VKLLILLLQLADPLLFCSQRLANTLLTILPGADLCRPPPDRGLADVRAFAAVPDTFALVSNHSNHVQLQIRIKCFALSCVMCSSSGGAFFTC